MKKKIISVFIAVIVLALMLSGCSLKMSMIDELVVPPKALGTNQELRDAIDNYLKDSSYVLKTPSSGDFRSAITVHDIDNNGRSEAIAFYQLSSKSDSIFFMLLSYNGTKWECVQNTEGFGNDIFSLEFADITGDGTKEIIISWGFYNNKNKKILSAYDYDLSKNENVLSQFKQTITFSSKITVDIDDDGDSDILTFNVDANIDSKGNNAVLYQYDAQANDIAEKGSVVLDGSVTGYAGAYVEKNNGNIVVYVDGYKGEAFMVTECVQWIADLNALVAPLYNAYVGATVVTSRNNRITTRDVNRDSKAEIAMSGTLMGESNDVCALVNWSQLQSNKTLSTVASSIINITDGYMLNIDTSWSGQVAINYNEKEHTMIVSQWDFINNSLGSDLCTITMMSQNQWRASPIDGFDILKTNGDMVYVGNVGESKNIPSFTFEELRSSLEIYK